MRGADRFRVFLRDSIPAAGINEPSRLTRTVNRAFTNQWSFNRVIARETDVPRSTISSEYVDATRPNCCARRGECSLYLVLRFRFWREPGETCDFSDFNDRPTPHHG